GILVITLHGHSLTTVRGGVNKPRRGCRRTRPMTHTPLFAAFSPKFVRAARLVGLVSALVVGGCASRPRQHRAAWARKPAAGRPATCPDHPVDVWGDGTPGPNDLRCSYEGTAGGQLIQLRGIVSEAAEGQALGQGLEKQRVE